MIYKAIIAHDNEWEYEDNKTISVFEQLPVFTGLVDINEVPIYKFKDPIGFDLGK